MGGWVGGRTLPPRPEARCPGQTRSTLDSTGREVFGRTQTPPPPTPFPSRHWNPHASPHPRQRDRKAQDTGYQERPLAGGPTPSLGTTMICSPTPHLLLPNPLPALLPSTSCFPNFLLAFFRLQLPHPTPCLLGKSFPCFLAVPQPEGFIQSLKEGWVGMCVCACILFWLKLARPIGTGYVCTRPT